MRHRHTLRNIYRFPLMLFTQPRKTNLVDQLLVRHKLPDEQSFAPNLQPSDLINSPLIEALVSARSLEGNATERALVKFYELGTQLHRVLCIHPSARNIQALHMLTEAGAETACIECPGSEDNLERLGFSVIHLCLTDWLQAVGATALAGYDGLLLDASTNIDLLFQLRDSVRPDIKIVIQGHLTDETLSKLKWVSAKYNDDEPIVFAGLPHDK